MREKYLGWIKKIMNLVLHRGCRPIRAGAGVFLLILLGAGIFLPVLLGAGASLPVQAEEQGEIIRVGYFPFPGFQEYDDKGKPYGYNVEYLDKIAEYTGWEYEYVPTRSWDDAMEKLKRREIDLAAPFQKTSERMENFLFSDYSIGTEYGALLTRKENTELSYEDFERFSNISIGYVKDSIIKEEFEEYAGRNNFTPKLTEYESTEQLQKALEGKEIDAMVLNFVYASGETRLLAKFSPSPYYYMMNPSYGKYMEELNNALDRIKTENPEFESQMMQQYYAHYTRLPFTKEEEEYVEGLPVIKVGYKTREPLCYQNEEGEDTGILIDIMKLISKNSGIRFSFQPLDKGMQSYEKLQEEGIQATLGVEYERVNLKLKELDITKPFFSSSKVIVGKKGADFERNAKFKMALDTGSPTVFATIKEQYPNAETLQYDSTEEALQAVLDKEADVMLQSHYAVRNLLQHPRYEKLTIVPGEGLDEELSLAFMKFAEEKEKLLADGRLLSVLNKSIEQLEEYELTDIVISYTSAKPVELTMGDFIYRYQASILIAGIALVLGGGIAVYAALMHQKNVEIVRKSERKLTGITSNIAGGVLVLLPDQGLKIQYANKGFWKMVGESEEAASPAFYRTYSQLEDLERLKWLLLEEEIEGNGIQMEVWIRKKDGTCIPAAFRGTLAWEGEQRLLYCVVVDITEQKQIQEQLEEEKERYELIIEQANDIIFDIDLLQKKVLWSKQYEKVFGWPGKEEAAGEAEDYFHVYEEDRENFGKLWQQLCEENNSISGELRICRKDKEPVWCQIFIRSMYRRGKKVRLVGRIADVDAQVKERMHLEEKSKTDGLTGLLNKEAFRLAVESAMNREACKKGSAMIFLDLDNFKGLNDTLGHRKGDQALLETARVIHGVFSENDYLGRFGGDEFVIFAPGMSLRRVLEKIEKLGKGLRMEYAGEGTGKKIRVSASIGFTYYEGGAICYEELLEQADKALYDAKAEGKDRYVMYQEPL